ncbi:MAG: hypothetical protein QM728_14970 [Gordonia sp. (in: high G+C Gram-positive bacteria)]|uniref:hypothetical protein n=1 Tax=Gordonia sp. (in: high G+C Gram-positive bacteria) TaxID=84139 RepID=UPI0039E6614C
MRSTGLVAVAVAVGVVGAPVLAAPAADATTVFPLKGFALVATDNGNGTATLKAVNTNAVAYGLNIIVRNMVGAPENLFINGSIAPNTTRTSTKPLAPGNFTVSWGIWKKGYSNENRVGQPFTMGKAKLKNPKLEAPYKPNKPKEKKVIPIVPKPKPKPAPPGPDYGSLKFW